MNMVKHQKQQALDRDDDADILSAFVALGGHRDTSGHVERSKLVSTVKVDFGLPINIEEMIDALDEDGSGEIEWPGLSFIRMLLRSQRQQY
jgi:Ca2+-binding EF-hand superfamily protein